MLINISTQQMADNGQTSNVCLIEQVRTERHTLLKSISWK